MLLIIKHAKPWCLDVIFHVLQITSDVLLVSSDQLHVIMEHTFLRAALLFILKSGRNCRKSAFSQPQGYEILIQILHISTSFCSAAGIVPVDYVQGIKGESVTFATSLKPGPESFLALTWSFNGTTNIVTSTSTTVVGEGYENRITLNKHTGPLVLSNLTEEDSREYELIIIRYWIQQLQGTARLTVSKT